MNIFTSYGLRLKKEFSGYNAKSFGKDMLAGVTVAAVALPLALALLSVCCRAVLIRSPVLPVP